MKKFLTSEQHLAYVTMHKKCKDKKKADRIKSILMLDKGFSYSEIAGLLLLDDMTIRRWHKLYESAGIKTLLKDNFVGRGPKLDIQQQEGLTLHLEGHIYLTAKEVAGYSRINTGSSIAPKARPNYCTVWVLVTRSPSTSPARRMFSGKWISSKAITG